MEDNDIVIDFREIATGRVRERWREVRNSAGKLLRVCFEVKPGSNLEGGGVGRTLAVCVDYEQAPPPGTQCVGHMCLPYDQEVTEKQVLRIADAAIKSLRRRRGLVNV